MNGRERGPQGGKAAYRCHDSIRLRQRCRFAQRIAAGEYPYIHIRKTRL